MPGYRKTAVLRERGKQLRTTADRPGFNPRGTGKTATVSDTENSREACICFETVHALRCECHRIDHHHWVPSITSTAGVEFKIRRNSRMRGVKIDANLRHALTAMHGKLGLPV